MCINLLINISWVLILQPIKIFLGPHGEELARDFTFIDDIVQGCVASLDTALPSTGSTRNKRKKAQFRIFNLGNTQPVKVGDFVSILEMHLKKKAKRKLVLQFRLFIYVLHMHGWMDVHACIYSI